MEENFKLDAKLKQDTFFITELRLCQILLMNNELFPWFIIVPKRNNIIELIDLCLEDQQILMAELVYSSNILKTVFQPDKINIATLGNIVPQLHIHIIARFKNDMAWPQPVWNKIQTKPYTDVEKNNIITQLRNYFNKTPKNEI